MQIIIFCLHADLLKKFYSMGKVFFLFALFTVLVFSTLAQTTHRFDADLAAASGVSDELAKVDPLSDARSLGVFSTGNRQIDRFIEKSSARHGIDPLLIFAQMDQESRFKLKALSHKGASGLMQLMPDTAERFGVKDIYDPEQNIEAGVKYMRWLLDKFDGDLRLALAGYNAGEGAVMKYGWQVPPYRETQGYVKKITANYRKMTSQSQDSEVLHAALKAEITPSRASLS